MSELEAIRRSTEPLTKTDFDIALANLGVREGDVLVAHASLSALGWVIGGAQTVLAALVGAIGTTGTLTMPAHSGGLSDPSNWRNPPVPEGWWSTIRAEMPAFDPLLTPLREMGILAETFHRMPGTFRSAHPTVSHMARGPMAEAITANHRPDVGLGDGSPLGRLYDAGAKILLLGVDHDNNTSLHLAEYRADWAGRRTRRQGSPIMRNGKREWVEYEELALVTDDFVAVGRAHAEQRGELTVALGAGRARCVDMRSLVDFATVWFSANRNFEAEMPRP